MRLAAPAALALTASCAAPQGVAFRDPQNGRVVTACQPLPGLAIAVDLAQTRCVDAYRKAGWAALSAATGQVAMRHWREKEPAGRDTNSGRRGSWNLPQRELRPRQWSATCGPSHAAQTDAG